MAKDTPQSLYSRAGRAPAFDPHHSELTKALMVSRKDELSLEDVVMPAPGPGAALVETAFVGICGTDLELLHGRTERGRPPVIPGHEWSGRVVSVGPGTSDELEGALVVGENVLARDEDDWMPEIGFELPGAFAQRFLVPLSHLRPVPDGVGALDAAMAEPVAVALHVVDRCVAGVGEALRDRPALVLGEGSLGQIIARLLGALHHARVAVVGVHDFRLRRAAELGAQRVLRTEELEAAVSAGERWPLVVEASGNVAALSGATFALQPRGLLVLAGTYPAGPGPSAKELVPRNARVEGVVGGRGRIAEAVNLIADGTLPSGMLRPEVHSIDDFESAFHRLESHPEACLKVCLQGVSDA